MSGTGEGRLDAPGLLYDMGRQVQALALAMRKHEIVADLNVCKSCGRIPARDLPGFGPRCQVVVDQWRVTQQLMRAFLRAHKSRTDRDDDDRGQTPGACDESGRSAKRD